MGNLILMIFNLMYIFGSVLIILAGMLFIQGFFYQVFNINLYKIIDNILFKEVIMEDENKRRIRKHDKRKING